MVHFHSQSPHTSDLEVFLRSFALVGVAELFDKTWFMGLILALRYNPKIVFAGSYSALALHTILAAAMGYAFARLISARTLHYMTAALFLLFTILYAKDWLEADPDSDAIAAGRKEAASEEEEGSDETASTKDAEQALHSDASGAQEEEPEGRTKQAEGSRRAFLAALGKSFMGVFIAEWGDRTQIAMIGQHASQPLVPVFLGSLVAFFLLTLSAVGAATLLQGSKLSERNVHAASAMFFAMFTLLALKDAFLSDTPAAVEPQ